MNRRLRIAAVTHDYPIGTEPRWGWATYQYFQALQALADVSVYCVISSYPKVLSLLRPQSLSSRRATGLCPATELPGSLVPYPAVPWLSRPVNGLSCARSLLPYLRRARPDVIVASFLYPNTYAALLCGKKLGIPVVAEAIGSDLRRVTNYWVRRCTRETVQDSAFVAAVSGELRQRAIAYGAKPEHVRVCRRGCDTEVFRPLDRAVAREQLGIAAGADLIVFVGRLIELKGIPDLFEAVAQLVPARPQVQVVCIGEGPILGALRARAGQPDLKDRVKLIGALPPAEVARWLAASNLLCLPSYSEGWPAVLTEALSCGRPVVATDVGGIPELVDSNCGFLAPPRSPTQLAEALRRCLDTKWDQNAIAERLHRSWSDSATELHELCLAAHRESPARTVLKD